MTIRRYQWLWIQIHRIWIRIHNTGRWYRYLAGLVGVVLLKGLDPARVVVWVGHHKHLQPPPGPVGSLVVANVPALLPHAPVRVVKCQLVVDLKRKKKKGWNQSIMYGKNEQKVRTWAHSKLSMPADGMYRNLLQIYILALIFDFLREAKPKFKKNFLR